MKLFSAIWLELRILLKHNCNGSWLHTEQLNNVYTGYQSWRKAFINLCINNTVHCMEKVMIILFRDSRFSKNRQYYQWIFGG